MMLLKVKSNIANFGGLFDCLFERIVNQLLRIRKIIPMINIPKTKVTIKTLVLCCGSIIPFGLIE